NGVRVRICHLSPPRGASRISLSAAAIDPCFPYSALMTVRQSALVRAIEVKPNVGCWLTGGGNGQLESHVLVAVVRPCLDDRSTHSDIRCWNSTTIVAVIEVVAAVDIYLTGAHRCDRVKLCVVDLASTFGCDESADLLF